MADDRLHTITKLREQIATKFSTLTDDPVNLNNTFDLLATMASCLDVLLDIAAKDIPQPETPTDE